MKSEQRIIKATIYAGWTELIVGFIMAITGWHDWYFKHFKFFGIMGLGMIFYAMWHHHFYKKETGKTIW